MAFKQKGEFFMEERKGLTIKDLLIRLILIVVFIFLLIFGNTEITICIVKVISSPKEKNVEDVRKENVDMILKFTEQLANNDIFLPKDVLENINKSIERKHNRVPLSSFQEAGVVTDNYVYSKVMEEEQSVGQALCAMRDEKLMDGWFPDNPRGFYASVATDVLGLDMSPTYPPNAIHNVLSHSDNKSFAIPTKEGAIVQVDISHIVGKEAYFMYNIKDKELVILEKKLHYLQHFLNIYQTKIFHELRAGLLYKNFPFVQL